MGMSHWEKVNSYLKYKKGKWCCFFLISTSGYIHSVVAKIEIEWKLTSHPTLQWDILTLEQSALWEM